MDFFLQYDSSTSAAINATAAQNFGITNITALYEAGLSVATQLQKVCMPVVAIAMLIRLLTFMTKLYGDKQVDFLGLGKLFLLVLFLFDYTEIMGQVNNIISYFTDNVQIMFDKSGSGHSIVDKVNEVYDHYKTKHPDPGFFDKLSNIMDYLIANCTHMIIVISRALTYIVRSLIMLFLFATGPIAILAAMFPGFEDNLKHWLKYYISVGFWMVTLAVLDLILYQYLQYCEDSDTLDGITTVNIGIALMYMIAPYLTSRYLSTHGSMFMSRMIQSATSVMSMAGRIGSSAKPTLQYGAEKSIGAGQYALGKIDTTLASKLTGGAEGANMARVTGSAYGGIKNNTIGKNQSEI
jgi:hypothetical protein